MKQSNTNEEGLFVRATVFELVRLICRQESASFVQFHRMMGDELLPKRSPDKNERLVVINDIYHVKYSVRNSLDKHSNFQS